MYYANTVGGSGVRTRRAWHCIHTACAATNLLTQFQQAVEVEVEEGALPINNNNSVNIWCSWWKRFQVYHNIITIIINEICICLFIN